MIKREPLRRKMDVVEVACAITRIDCGFLARVVPGDSPHPVSLSERAPASPALVSPLNLLCLFVATNARLSCAPVERPQKWCELHLIGQGECEQFARRRRSNARPQGRRDGCNVRELQQKG